nr:hypothetical protein [Tanacetum cinerariifolium]
MEDLIQVQGKRFRSRLLKILVAKKRLKIAFENANLSSRVELIPSKIKYAIKVVLSFHNEFLVFSSLSRKGNDGLLQDQVFKNKEEEMAHPVQNINHSAFRSMFEKEKLSGNNFNDWFRQLKLVLRVEKKMFVIKQPLPVAPAADSAVNVLAEWNPLSLNLCLRNKLEWRDFAEFVRKYNMHNIGKTINEIHAILIEYENGLPKKAKTPQVMMIKGGKIQKANKKSLKAKGTGKAKGKGKDKQVYIAKPKNPKHAAKEHPTKDDTYHHCKEVGHWKRNCPVYLDELMKKQKQVGYASSPVIARYAEFFEKNLITQEVSRRAIDLEEIQDKDTSPSEITSEIPIEVEGFKPPQEEVIPIHMSERTHRAPNRLCLNVKVEEHSLGDLNKPASYKAAILDSESNKWIDVMNAEIQSMIDNMVWVLVDLPPSFKTVGSKWIFKKKTDIDAAYYDYEIWKMDVKTAFLNGYLDEDIYMGLKQASRSWNKRFDEEIKKFGFAQNLDEPCVYQKASGSNVTFLILYVDDIIIIGSHILSLQSVKDYLGKCFAMKDLGETVFILGIKIYRDRSKRLIGLGQNAYMDKILKRYNMDNSKRGHILVQERLSLNKTQGASTPKEVKRMQNVPYASAVGSIIIRIDIGIDICTRLYWIGIGIGINIEWFRLSGYVGYILLCIRLVLPRSAPDIVCIASLRGDRTSIHQAWNFDYIKGLQKQQDKKSVTCLVYEWNMKLEDLEQKPSNGPFIAEWEAQYSHLGKLRPPTTALQISSTHKADFMFKINFITLFESAMETLENGGRVPTKLLKCIREDEDISDIDWCACILDCLYTSKFNWKDVKTQKNFYYGPLTFLCAGTQKLEHSDDEEKDNDRNNKRLLGKAGTSWRVQC